MDIRADFDKLSAYLAGSPWMANLNAALESKTNLAVLVGTVDNCSLIRETFGIVSLDHVFPKIEKLLHERFGDHSVWWGAVFPFFLIQLTGDEANHAVEIAEAIRTTVESTSFDDQFHVTMHFGVTHASSSWAAAGGFRGLMGAADKSIELGKMKQVANRVYDPANVSAYEEWIGKRG